MCSRCGEIFDTFHKHSKYCAECKIQKYPLEEERKKIKELQNKEKEI